MNPLKNLEKVIESIDRACDNLQLAEDYWDDSAWDGDDDEIAVVAELECKIIELKEELEDISYSLEKKMEKLEDELEYEN